MDFDDEVKKLEEWFAMPCEGFVGKKIYRKSILMWLAYFFSIYGVNFLEVPLYSKLFFVFSGMVHFSEHPEELEKYYETRILERIDKKFYIELPQPPIEENNNNDIYKPGGS